MRGQGLIAPALLLALIQRSAWKGNSAKLRRAIVRVVRLYLRVDLADEERRSASGKVRDVVGCRLSFRRAHAALQLLDVLEVTLEDSVVGRLATVWRSDDPGRLVPLKVGYFIDQRHVGIGVVLLKSIWIIRVSVEHR